MYQRPRRTLDSVSVVHLRLIWYVEYVSAIFLDRRGILESLQNIYVPTTPEDQLYLD